MRIPSLLCVLAATVGCAGGSASGPARTRLLSVVRRAPDGAYRIEQSILVECDVPHFQEWAYARDGRTLPSWIP